METQQKPKVERKGYSWGKLVAGIALALVAFILQAVITLVCMNMEFGLNESMTAAELGGGIFALLFVVILGGWAIVKPKFEGCRFALRASAWIIGVDIVLIALNLIAIFTGQQEGSISATWPIGLLLCIVLCIGIGMFEEGVFRGLVFEGLLTRMGTTKRGIIAAIVISSILFGAAHVVPDPAMPFEPLSAAQMVLKCIQTGIVGFVLAVIVIKTKSLWPAIFIHALDDFLLMFIEVGIYDTPLETDYVLSGDEGMTTLIVYIVLSFIYLPSLIYCIKQLKQVQAPQRGAFFRSKPQGPPPTQQPLSPTQPQLEGQTQVWQQALPQQQSPLSQQSPMPQQGQIPQPVHDPQPEPVPPQPQPSVQPQPAPTSTQNTQQQMPPRQRPEGYPQPPVV